jgi:hypothetical protein
VGVEVAVIVVEMQVLQTRPETVDVVLQILDRISS